MTKKDKPVGFSGVRTLQFQEELDAFIEVMKAEGVTSYLEIGAHHGDTLHQVGLALPEGSRLVGVDLPGATAGNFKHSWKALERACKDLTERGRPSTYFNGDSHDPWIVDVVKVHAPFDAVFIDGDHSMTGVLQDWEEYGLAMGSKLVAFHDIMKIGGRWQGGVNSLWTKLKQQYRHQTISVHPEKRGIGIIWLS